MKEFFIRFSHILIFLFCFGLFLFLISTPFSLPLIFPKYPTFFSVIGIIIVLSLITLTTFIGPTDSID